MKKNSFLITPIKFLILAMTMVISFTACDDDDDDDDRRSFTVTIQNVSNATTLQAGALPDRTGGEPVSTHGDGQALSGQFQGFPAVEA